MKEYIRMRITVFDGVFSSLEKAENHIQNSNESYECVEYGITKTMVQQ